jgi:hypothetical protein
MPFPPIHEDNWLCSLTVDDCDTLENYVDPYITAWADLSMRCYWPMTNGMLVSTGCLDAGLIDYRE